MILPLRFWEAVLNRAWEGFQNRWNKIVIHPWRKVKMGKEITVETLFLKEGRHNK